MARVLFENVTKEFGSVKAVNDVSLEIQDGELLCLLGPSGCGKTTTLRLIAGLETATSGRIHIGDTDVTRFSPKDRDVGMVFQDYALYPHMNLADNIAYPLKVRKVREAARMERAKEVADHLRIGHLMERLPGQISGGQQQRTSVARAVVHEPRVFLFDEPLSNLDAKLRLESRGFIKHLQQEMGVTAVYVTHDQAEAMALADRIAVMQDGVIVQIGSPLEIYRNPQTSFVANFLGSPPMNLFDAEVRNGSFVGSSFELDAKGVKEHSALNDGDSVTLGIRPEHVRVSPKPMKNSIASELYAFEALGPESILSFRIDEQLLVARAFGDDPPEIEMGQTAYLSFEPRHLHLFNEHGSRVNAD